MSMPFDRIVLATFLDNLPSKIIHTAEYQQQLLPRQPAHSCRPTFVLLQRTGPSCTCHRGVFAPGHTWFDFSRRL